MKAALGQIVPLMNWDVEEINKLGSMLTMSPVVRVTCIRWMENSSSKDQLLFYF
uniref:Uncharacterized protein n=1 Tax=Arundo donax TaxID=35708 RepID=A0A0A9BQK6_ARUDO